MPAGQWHTSDFVTFTVAGQRSYELPLHPAHNKIIISTELGGMDKLVCPCHTKLFFYGITSLKQKSPYPLIGKDTGYVARNLPTPPSLPSKNTVKQLQAGLLTNGSSYSLLLPIHIEVNSGYMQFSSPFTAAGPCPNGLPFLSSFTMGIPVIGSLYLNFQSTSCTAIFRIAQNKILVTRPTLAGRSCLRQIRQSLWRTLFTPNEKRIATLWYLTSQPSV